jgi:6-phosphogluconolactonase
VVDRSSGERSIGFGDARRHDLMHVEVAPDRVALAVLAAGQVGARLRSIVHERGSAVFAVSGGTTPWEMLAVLARDATVPWERIVVAQVDERIAPAGDGSRNLVGLQRVLLDVVPEVRVLAMPVESGDAPSAASAYAADLRGVAGDPPVIDLVHLGLGPDGHCASLVPGDPVLEVTDADVGVTGEYQGRRRMTLTYPALDRAREIVWLVAGADKRQALSRLLARDPAIPAGRLRHDRARLLADEAAAGT